MIKFLYLLKKQKAQCTKGMLHKGFNSKVVADINIKFNIYEALNSLTEHSVPRSSESALNFTACCN